MVYNKLIKYLKNNSFSLFSNELFIDEDKLTDEQKKYILALSIKSVKFINIILDFPCFIYLFDKNLIYNIIDLSNDEIIIKIFILCNKDILQKCFCKIFDLLNKDKLINKIIDNKLIDINYIDKYGKSYLSYSLKNYKSISLKLCNILNIDLSHRDLYNNSLLSLTKDKDIIETILETPKKFLKERNLNITKYSFDDIFYLENVKYNKGGYGKVYPVIKKKDRKVMILKYFYNNEGSFNCDIITEMFLILRINKTYINPLSSIINGFIYDKDNFYLLLEPLDLTLDNYLNILRYTEKYNLEILLKNIFNSLYQIHSLGIMHGDIKSSNIMISNNQCYMIDYGISQNFLYSTNNYLFNEYKTTANVSAPEVSDCIMIIIIDEEIVINKKRRFSYSADIFSLGVTILQCILNTNYNYIYYENNLYKTRDFNLEDNPDIEYTKVDISSQNIPDYIYKMVSYNENERPTLKNLLGIKRENTNIPIVEYKLNFINNTQYMFVKNITHYSINDIIHNKYELEYLDEIYNSYKNDIFKIDNISNSLFLDSFDKFLYGLTKKENICFDSIINSIEYCLNGNFLFSNMVYSFFSNIGGSLSTFESDYYNDFAISCLQNNIIYKPVMIYIQYYIIKLSYIVNQDELSKIEWLLIKKILLIFILLLRKN